MFADPERPIDLDSFIAFTGGERGTRSHFRAASTLFLAAAAVLFLAAVSALVSPQADAVARSALKLQPTDWKTPFAVVSIFLAGAALMIPVTVLIVAASAMLGLVWGLLYAAVGTVVSAAAFYGLGAWLGSGVVRRVLGGRLAKVRDAIKRRGVFTIAVVRMVPIAPFSFINLAAGATGIGFWPFIIGTIIGMAPGFIVLSALGDQLYRMVTEPTMTSMALVLGLILLWLGSLIAARSWFKRHARTA